MLILRIIAGLIKPRFPFDLTVSSSRLCSSLNYNPYSDYPPKLRWELGVTLAGLGPKPARQESLPYITYSLDIAPKGWLDLPGSHDTSAHSGSDLWIGDTNYGPVFAQEIEVTVIEGAKVRIKLILLFGFSEVRYRPEKKVVEFYVDYDGFTFRTPIWNKPGEVTFPEAWRVPSSHADWSDAELKDFVSKYVDLKQYSGITISREGGSAQLLATL